mgnify:CR=1 FL=1
MKKLILCFMLVFSSLFSFAQYEPLVVEDTHLYFARIGLGFDVPLDYIIREDTMVNNEIYKKVFLCQNPALFTVPQLSHLIREDTLQKRVYMIPFEGSDYDLMSDSCEVGQEHLFFDFDSQVGDTLDHCWLKHDYADSSRCVISDIDTTLFWQINEYRRVFVLDYTWWYTQSNGNVNIVNKATRVIEGMGTLSGPILIDIEEQLGFPSEFFNYEINPDLTCLDVEYDPNLDAISNVFTANNIKAFPSPANDILHIETDKFVNNGSYKLSTIAGQVMKAGQFSGHRAEMTVNELPTGIYFIQIFDKTQLLAVGKVLVK